MLVTVVVSIFPSTDSIAIIPSAVNNVAVANIPGIAGEPVSLNLLPPKNHGTLTLVRGILNLEFPRFGMMKIRSNPAIKIVSGANACQNSVLNTSTSIQIPPKLNTPSKKATVHWSIIPNAMNGKIPKITVNIARIIIPMFSESVMSGGVSPLRDSGG